MGVVSHGAMRYAWKEWQSQCCTYAPEEGVEFGGRLLKSQMAFHLAHQTTDYLTNISQPTRTRPQCADETWVKCAEI